MGHRRDVVSATPIGGTVTHAMSPTHVDLLVPGAGALHWYRGTMSSELRAAGLGIDVVADIVLVACELLTNAFTHGRAAEARTTVDIDDAHVDMTVSHDGAAPVDMPTRPVAMPSPGAISGRGLAIVDAITTDRRVVVDAGTVSVWCRFGRVTR